MNYTNLYTTTQVDSMFDRVVTRRAEQTLEVSTGEHALLPVHYCAKCGTSHGQPDGLYSWERVARDGSHVWERALLCPMHAAELIQLHSTIQTKKLLTLTRHTIGVWTVEAGT